MRIHLPAYELGRRGLAAGLTAIGMTALLILPACSTPRNTLWITDYRDGRATPYRETFDECYFARDAGGNVNVVLRRERPVLDDPTRNLVQLVWLQTFWTPVPGTTVAHERQINATVRYALVSGRVTAAFEGAGSVFLDSVRGSDRVDVRIRQAFLTPRGQIFDGRLLFRNAELKGAMRATQDPARVVRLTNDMDRLFESLQAAAP